MFSAFKKFGKLGALASSVARAWSPLSLWPDGISSAGMWISPRTLTSEWQDYTGTTPVVTPGTVADSANPVGLALDIRAGATVLTDPGNHMLQSTSAARPLMSARVNLITGSEDFTVGSNWGAGDTTLETGFIEGGVTFSKFVENTTTANHDRFAKIGLPSGVHCIYSAKFKSGERSIATIRTWDATYTSDASCTTYFDLTTQDIQLASNGVTTAGIIPEGNGIFRCWVGITPNHNTAVGSPSFGMSTSFGAWTYAGDGVSGLYVGGAQVEFSDSLGVYQAIGPTGTYSGVVSPIFQKYDGVDDGMATAAFSAGTLINGMDCMIAVRRDSAALVIAGLYETAGLGTRYTGYAEIGVSGPCFAGAGAPTVWVDDVQLSGGTSVTAGTLHTALTVGDWHILEFRNLDLSAWTAAAFGRYTGGIFNGARGDIMLYPSTDPTEDKDAARQYLADYYGVTLP